MLNIVVFMKTWFETIEFNNLMVLKVGGILWGNTYLCDVSITERPSFTMLLIQFHKNRLAPGSIPVVGSSCMQIMISRRYVFCSHHQLVCSWLMESSFHSWFCIFARVLLFYVWFQPCTPSTTCNKPACWKYLLIVEFLPILSYSKLSFWISLSTFNRYFDKLNNVCNVM